MYVNEDKIISTEHENWYTSDRQQNNVLILKYFLYTILLKCIEGMCYVAVVKIAADEVVDNQLSNDHCKTSLALTAWGRL